MATIESYATRALLAAASNTPRAAYLTEAGREGMFVWTSGNLSTAVSADPQQGVYVAPSGTPSGANGAWVREYDTSLEVNWFGAVGNGVANDTPVIQAAIDLAFALGGRNVLVRSGVYRLLARTAPDGAGLACLEMKSGVSLVGEGKERSILRLGANQINSNTYFRIVMSQNTLQNSSITDLEIDGNQAQQAGHMNAGNGGAILLARSQQVTVERVSVQNANGQGIQISAPVGNVSSDLRITGCSVFNCRGDGNSGIGIQVSQFSRLLITDNLVNNTVGNGIDVYGENGSTVASATDFVISGNIVSNSDNGIFPETARNGIVTGNIVRECRNAGIRINRINGAPSLLQIENNQIDLTPTSLAISGDADGSRGITVQDNVFSNFSGAGGGIVLGGSGGNVSYIVARNNTFCPATSTVPFVVIVPGTVQAAFIRVYDNHFQGSPNPGFRFVNYAATTFLTFVGGWIGLQDVSGYDLERLSIATQNFTLQAPAVPATATSAGNKGQIAYDDGFVYVCVNQNAWKRSALSTF